MAQDALPEIHDVRMDPKYPQEADEITFYARAFDPEGNVTNVYLSYCLDENCFQDEMFDPDHDEIYNATIGPFPAGKLISQEIIAVDNSTQTNQTPKVYFRIVSYVSVEFQLDSNDVKTGDTVWANGTALYDENASTPVESSDVELVIEGTTISVSNSTDSDGEFNIQFQAPDVADSYEVNVSVTNRSLSNYSTAQLVVNEHGDSDGDGLRDDVEIGLGTDPLDTDTDDDGLDDYEEVYEGDDGYITDPTNEDTDGDGTIDSEDWEPTDPSVQHEPKDEDLTWILLVTVVIIVVVLVVMFLLIRRRREIEEV